MDSPPRSSDEMPQDTLAEETLIGMASSELFGNVAQECAFLKPDQFYTDRWSKAWKCVQALHARGDEVNLVTLNSELLDLNEMGPGRAFETISEITATWNHIPSSANAKTHARSIWRAAMKRKMRFALNHMAGVICTDADPAMSLNSIGEEYEALQKEMAGEAGKRKRLVSDEEAEQMPPIEYVIDEWLPVKSVVALFGDTGTWKTYQVLSMFLSIPTGQPWHGYNINKQGITVYVAAEAPETIGERVHAWKQHFRIHGPTGFHMWTEAVNLMDAGSVEDFISTLRAELPTLPVAIGFDTLALSMDGGDPNLDRDINIVYGSLRRIRDALDGPTIMFVDHEGKDSTRGMSGSNKKRANADVVIRVQKQLGGMVKLKREKMRGRPEDEDGMLLRRIHVPADETGRPGQIVFERCPDSTSQKQTNANGADKQSSANTNDDYVDLPEDLYGLLRTLWEKKKALGWREWQKVAGIPLQRRVPKLLASELVEQNASGDYVMTMRGVRALQSKAGDRYQVLTGSISALPVSTPANAANAANGFFRTVSGVSASGSGAAVAKPDALRLVDMVVDVIDADSDE